MLVALALGGVVLQANPNEAGHMHNYVTTSPAGQQHGPECHRGPGASHPADCDSTAGAVPGPCCEVPPIGNTGALNTNSVKIDYLEVTFKTLSLEGVLEHFTPVGAGDDEWAELPCGRNGYRRGKVRGMVRAFFDGGEGMGVHVEASGQGCRQLEAEGVVGSWEGSEGFAARLLKAEACVTRIDVVFDDRLGYITPERVEAAVTEGRCVSKFKKSRPHVENDLKSGAQVGGWTRYFGSAQSKVRVRMYDKAEEQRQKGHQVEGPWVRAELQLRDQRGQWALERLTLPGAVADLAGLMLNYVDFKEGQGEDTNRSRWKTCRWWMDFLCNAEKCRCTVATAVRTLEGAAEWIQRQVAPTLALLLNAKGYGADFFEAALEQGHQRLKHWQWALLTSAPAGGVA